LVSVSFERNVGTIPLCGLNMSTNLQNVRFIIIYDVCGTMTPISGTKKASRL
jgi:hypothetical protein